MAGVLVSLRFGGLRAALWALAAFAAFAGSGLWVESMQTLALMLAAVGLSLAIGIPLGILAGLSDRFERGVTPVLDAMQIIPAFAYLMPIVILFSVGPGAAVITTMIYAIPPAIRITALGIRGVPANTVEAALAMGSTRSQTLAKVRLPLARRMLLLSVNQTILFALSMVVIAGLIGGKGLGDVVTSGLNSYPALALLAGLVIVVMAMALDRVTEAVAEQTNPARRHLTDDLRRRLRLATVATAIAVVAVVAVARIVGRRRRLLPHDRPRLAARTAPVRTGLRPEPRHVPVPDHELGRRPHRPVRARALPGLPRGDALAGDAHRGHVDLARGQRAALGDHDVPDARR